MFDDEAPLRPNRERFVDAVRHGIAVERERPSVALAKFRRCGRALSERPRLTLPRTLVTQRPCVARVRFAAVHANYERCVLMALLQIPPRVHSRRERGS